MISYERPIGKRSPVQFSERETERVERQLTGSMTSDSSISVTFGPITSCANFLTILAIRRQGECNEPLWSALEATPYQMS